MQIQVACRTIGACWAVMTLCAVTGHAANRKASNVPPTLEIEVLDPGVDPLGNPAVLVRPDEYGQLQVDIPPVVLVHRYYYTGDRSFQAQLLPGGPSIVVANHPRTGERCYVPVQMLPGAPRVTYTSSSIEYDYGETGITVQFKTHAPPTIKYRNGLPWHRKIGNAVHADQWRDRAEKLHDSTKNAASRSRTLASGAMIKFGDTSQTILLPAANLLEMMPGGKIVFGTDWEQRLASRAAEHRRDKANRHAEKDQRWADFSIPTNR